MGRAKKTTQDLAGASPTVCTLPMVPCGSSPVSRFALASAMRKTKRMRRRLFCIHIYHLQKALPINHSITAILSRHATRRSGTLQDKKAAWAGRPIPYELDQPIIVSSRKVPPHKGTKEALRDKTKSCCTGRTCQHNNTKS